MNMFEQDRVIVRLQQRVLRETSILACFLSGSYGRRTDDQFSDLDVALIFADEQIRAEAWTHRRQFVRSVLPYVPVRSFDADHVRPYFHIALYGNGSKVDYRYETQGALLPNPWDSEVRIVKDTDGWAERFQQASSSKSLTQPRLSVEELTSLDNRFWVMFWDTLRLLKRGDWHKPFTIYVELLHFTFPAILNVLPPEDPARAPLLQAYYSSDTELTVNKLAKTMRAYLSARQAVTQRFSLQFKPDTAFEKQILQLVKRLTD